MAPLLSFLFTTTMSGFFTLTSLSHWIITSCKIFNNTFWSMFIPFFACFQFVFLTQFLVNYSCNIVPSLVLLLCQLFLFAHNMRYCLTFLVTQTFFSQFCFPHPTLLEFLLTHCIVTFYCFCSFHNFSQWHN